MPQIERIQIDDAVRVGIALHKEGHIDEAEMVYRDILEAAPGHPDAQHFLGVLLHQLGRSDEALELIGSALETVTDNTGMWINFGNINMSCRRYDEAEQAYLRARALAPQAADVHCNLGTLYHGAGRDEEARNAFEQALALDAQHGESHYNFANFLRGKQEFDAAVQHYQLAAEHFTQTRSRAKATANLASSLLRAGKQAEGERVLREWLLRDPENATALHMLAAATGEAVPERASDGYVTELFDAFAESFDESLERLAYQGPKLVGETVQRRLGEARGDLAVLDAGCGTGLGAAWLRPFAAVLTGVDLSPGMIAKARQRQSYDVLEVAELTAFLGASPAAYDVITCIDVLCYFGRLDAILEGAVRSLRPGGLLCFSVERAETTPDGVGFKLETHGRYAHHRRYLASLLEQCGCRDVEIDEAVLRLEGGSAVSGLVVSALAPS